MAADTVRFPNESDDYRAARIELLKAEMELRRQTEEVAARRRRLPLSGPIPQDYLLEEGPRDLHAPESVKQVRFSHLFEPGKDTLIVCSFMYGPQMEKACPMCTSMLDGLDGQAQHVTQRRGDRVHHFYNAELLFAPRPEGQHPRHVDSIWPLWNLFDLTPQGRGTDWYPRLGY